MCINIAGGKMKNRDVAIIAVAVTYVLLWIVSIGIKMYIISNKVNR